MNRRTFMASLAGAPAATKAAPAVLTGEGITVASYVVNPPTTGVALRMAHMQAERCLLQQHYNWLNTVRVEMLKMQSDPYLVGMVEAPKV